MQRHIYLSVLMTFAVGLAVGVLVFFQSRTGEVSTATPVTETEGGFEILGYKYGGCEKFGCTSYRILHDGSYTFIERNKDGEDRRYEDVISPKRLSELETLIADTDFEKILGALYTGICPVEYDGVAFRYEVRRGEERFSLDSCREDLDTDPLFVHLADYFEIFSVTHRNE